MNRSRMFRLRVFGENACFTRPEMKVERVSYDVITPSAARGIFEAVFWKPAICWKILRIDLLKPIKWESVRRNEVGKKVVKPSGAHLRGGFCKSMGIFIEKERQQRANLLLKNVDYVIHADFIMTNKAGVDENITKFEQMFARRASKGQCFHQPYFGCREFPVSFELLETEDMLTAPIKISRDLGWMLYDMDYSGKEPVPQFFHAELTNGSIDLKDVEVRS
jgi:CRISPR-associated protein Cas5d